MKKILLTMMLATSLSGCSVLTGLAGIPESPKSVADKTTLDERIAIGIELAYQGAALAASTAIKAGLVKDADLQRVADADTAAYKAVTLARGAYKAGNAENYFSAVSEARAAISGLIALVKGEVK